MAAQHPRKVMTTTTAQEQDRHGGIPAAEEMPEPLPVVDLGRLPAADDGERKPHAAIGDRASSSRETCLTMDESKKDGSVKLVADVETAKRLLMTFEPSVWGEYFIGAGPMPCEHQGSTKERRDDLIEEVRLIIEHCSTDENLLKGMQTIDSVERLGIGYHFEREIGKFMDILNNTGHEEILNNIPDKDASFLAVAIRFRLLRQHRFDVPCDVFDDFLNEKGELNKKLQCNADALVSLYEAAFLGKPEEKFLESAVEWMQM